MLRTPHKGSPIWTSCPDPLSSIVHATTGAGVAPSAVRVVTATVGDAVHFMIWGPCDPGVRGRFTSYTPNTGARTAMYISMRTCPTLRYLGRITPRGSWSLQYGRWWRTDCPIAPHPGTCGEAIGCSCHSPPSRTGSRRREKKASERVERDYLNWALSEFSGYIAADELYDGPFCVLSIVDNCTFHRLIYEVLDHDPTKKDVERFFVRFKAVLDARGLILHGITTDGSPLYPEPIAQVFGDILHQICEFHVIAELTKAVLKAVTKARRSIKAKMPTLPRGRPATQEAKRAAQRKKRLQKKVADLFDHRLLFVQHHLTTAERKTLTRITRGLPQLRTLREIMDEVYRLFDRRCRTETALAKLSKLRARVRRFKTVGKTLQKLFSPNLEKALTFLDDSILPSTSNAVERGNRRHRKMQKSIYGVRTQHTLVSRMALDHIRDWYTIENAFTLCVLHKTRPRRSSSRKGNGVVSLPISAHTSAPLPKVG
jgi:hypothetical protein